jgi:hypothetical protein
VLVLVLAAQARGATRHPHVRPVEKRIAWLEQRLQVHRFGCRHPRKVRRSEWYCHAGSWTRRELREARRELWRRDWAWWIWLPDKYARVGACETGYGKRPGRWDWDSGRYVSAFGIYRPAYAQFAHQLGLRSWDEPGVRTAREQYRVARAIHARYGWGAWGCEGA